MQCSPLPNCRLPSLRRQEISYHRVISDPIANLGDSDRAGLAAPNTKAVLDYFISASPERSTQAFLTGFSSILCCVFNCPRLQSLEHNATEKLGAKIALLCKFEGKYRRLAQTSSLSKSKSEAGRVSRTRAPQRLPSPRSSAGRGTNFWLGA